MFNVFFLCYTRELNVFCLPVPDRARSSFFCLRYARELNLFCLPVLEHAAAHAFSKACR
jgi:hypothetical protein